MYYNNHQKNYLTAQQIVPTYVNVLPKQPTYCDFNLNPGWNLVSFFCLGMFVNRDEVLQPIEGHYVKIFSYNPTDSTDPWKSYNPTLPAWTVQQLNFMDRVSGYWIYMNDSTAYIYNGTSRSSVISLYYGWNLIGYPDNKSRLINESTSDLLFNIIRTYDNSSDSYKDYIKGAQNNALNYFDPYAGYWINSSAIQSLMINVS